MFKIIQFFQYFSCFSCFASKTYGAKVNIYIFETFIFDIGVFQNILHEDLSAYKFFQLQTFEMSTSIAFSGAWEFVLRWYMMVLRRRIKNSVYRSLVWTIVVENCEK